MTVQGLLALLRNLAKAIFAARKTASIASGTVPPGGHGGSHCQKLSPTSDLQVAEALPSPTGNLAPLRRLHKEIGWSPERKETHRY